MTQIGSVEFWMSSLRGFTLALLCENNLLNTGQANMARLVTNTKLLTTWGQLNSLQQPSVSLHSAQAKLSCFGRGMIVMQQSTGKMVSAQPLTIIYDCSMRMRACVLACMRACVCVCCFRVTYTTTITAYAFS